MFFFTLLRIVSFHAASPYKHFNCTKCDLLVQVVPFQIKCADELPVTDKSLI